LETVAREKGIDCDTIEIWFADEARIGQKEQNHSPLGEARHPPQCAARSAYRFHLYLRRSLPQGGQGRGPNPAGLQQRGDEPASCRDRQSGRARCPCPPLGRSRRLPLVDPPRRAGKHHHHCAAAKMPRAQSGRKCLAVHARQLALEPSLQILRRSRRPLLQRLEQAGRSALAHHVHWTAPMGARVLIKGNWYNAAWLLDIVAKGYFSAGCGEISQLW